jgi:hypothetical protein
MFRNLTEDATIEIYFETFASTGAPVAPSSAFTTSDFAIYKNGSATAKATTNGLTVTSPFNSEAGCHLLVIDTSNDTGDTGFWTTGARYQVKFNTAKTVGSQSIDGASVPRGSFGIQSEYEGANVVSWRGSTPNALTSGRVDGIVGAYASGQAPLQPTTAGRTLDVTATGAAGIDWANIENPTSLNQFSGSYIALQNNQNVNLNDGAITASKFAANAITASALAADAATEIGAATLTALGTGTWATAIPWNAAWDAEVQSECADAITAAGVMTGTYTAPDNATITLINAKTTNLPSDPADASDISAAFGTVNTTLSTIAGYIDTEIASIKTKTDNLPTDPADQSLIVAATDAIISRLGSPVGASMSADIASVKTDTGNLVTRIPAALFSGITSLADWIRRISRKDAGTAGMIAAEAEIDTGGTSTFTGTTDSLEAIADASGGGAGDASQTTLLAVKAKTDLIGTAQGITSLEAAAVLDAGTISGFPTELIVGDSYDSDSGEIDVTIVGAEGDPITSMGSLNFSAATIEFTAYRTGDPSSMHLSGTCTYANSIVSITLPSSVTALGKPEFTYEGRLKFIWTAADAQKTFKTTQFKFVENP